MSQTVRFLRLEIEGFGVWRSPTLVEFPERFGVLAMPNEAGKSTLVAALRFLIFGLPGESDPSVPGIGRYRSWGWEGSCRGRLDLRADDRTIRIRRDFATHKTTVDEVDSSGAPRMRLFDGVANPAGKTAVREEYREVLKGILGDLADPSLRGDLFAASFLVAQPIRIEETAGQTLVKLVSGVGRVGGEKARESIFNRVKALTRETKILGLVAPGRGQAVAQRTDGEIERIAARIRDLQARRDAVRDGFDRQNRLDDALARAEEAYAEAAGAEEHARLDAERLASFRKELERTADARAAHRELKSALERYEEAIGGAEEMERNRDSEFPDLEDAPADLEARIEEIARLEVALGAAREAEAEWVARGEERTAELRSRQNERWSRDAEAAEEAPAWLAQARAATGRFCEAVSRRLALAEEKRRLLETRQSLAAVGALPETVQEEILRLDESLRLLEDRQILLEQLNRQRQSYRQRYTSLEGIDPGRFIAQLQARAARHRRLAEIAAEIERAKDEAAAARPRRSRLRGAIFGVLAAALGALGALAIRLPAFAAVAAAAVLFAAVFLVASRKPRRLREAETRLASLEGETADLQGRLRSEFLPPIPGLADDADSPERAEQVFGERNADAQAIRDLEAALGEVPEADDPETGVDRMRDRGARLRATAQDLQDQTGRPGPDAVRDYREAGAAVARIEGEMADSEGELLGEPGGEAADPMDLPPERLAPAWSRVRAAAALLEIPAATIRDLHDGFAAVAPEQWAAWDHDARRYAELRSAEDHARSEIRRAQERRDDLERRLNEEMERIGPARLAASGGSVARLRDRMRERDELTRQAASVREAASHLLTAAREGPYENRESLEAAIEGKDEVLRHSQKAATEARESSELLRSYEVLDASSKDRLLREVETKAQEARSRLDAARVDRERAAAELKAWSPPAGTNIAQLELEIASLAETLSIQERRRDAAARAWHILGEAIEEYRSAHRATLEEKIDARFRAITGRDNRRVTLGSGLEIGIFEEGMPAVESQLSQGAQDQLAFCLRLAVADLIAGEILLPVVLDDPFVHSDAERLERIRAALEVASEERQVILLTQDARLAAWGSPIRATPA